MHQVGKTVDEKVEVFKEPQKAEIHHHTENEDALSFYFIKGIADYTTKLEVHESRDHDQAQKSPIPPTIKDITGDQ